MKISPESMQLREIIRTLERKLGLLENTQLSCCGITFTQCHALVEIGRAERITLNVLAALLDLEDSTMSRTVNNLVTKGLAARTADERDRRYVAISLTDAGMALFRNIETGMESYFSDIVAKIPEDKRAQVLDSMQILLDAVVVSGCCK